MTSSNSDPERIRYTLNTLEEAENFAQRIRDAGYKDIEVKPLYHPSDDHKTIVVGMSVFWTEENIE